VTSSVPIMTKQAFGGVAMVNLSSLPLSGGARTRLAIETQLQCPGAWNVECGIWDHMATLAVQCPGHGAYTIGGGFEAGGSFAELARYATPYRLGVGNWVTDITPLAPLLSRSVCKFQLDMVGWAEKSWVWTVTLRAAAEPHATSGGLPFQSVPLFSNNEPVVRQTFNRSYNVGRKLTFEVPSETVKVELYALISGHGEDSTGCCEFLPTRHTFNINGHEFAVEFMEPSDMYGCARPDMGVEPNGYGAWWFGRNGWCPGQRVRPIVIDVSAALLAPGARLGENVASYAGKMWNATASAWMDPCAESGYIIMASHLAFYQQGEAMVGRA